MPDAIEVILRAKLAELEAEVAQYARELAEQVEINGDLNAEQVKLEKKIAKIRRRCEPIAEQDTPCKTLARWVLDVLEGGGDG